jgi:hypothetical protein
MIIEWLMQLVGGVVDWLTSLFPPVLIPADIENLDSTLTGLINDNSAGLAPFIDFGFIGSVIGIPLAIWGAAVLIKAIRAAAAHIPFFGGRG